MLTLDKVLEEGDVGKMLAKEKDLLYVALIGNESRMKTLSDWLANGTIFGLDPRYAKEHQESSDFASKRHGFAEASFRYLMLHFHCQSGHRSVQLLDSSAYSSCEEESR
jgi:hypothetical protein